MWARRVAQFLPIGIPYLLENLSRKNHENVVYKKLKHLDDVIFRVLVFRVSVPLQSMFLRDLKHLGSSSGHTLTCCLNLVKYRLKNMFWKESLTRSSTVI